MIQRHPLLQCLLIVPYFEYLPGSKYLFEVLFIEVLHLIFHIYHSLIVGSGSQDKEQVSVILPSSLMD